MAFLYGGTASPYANTLIIHEPKMIMVKNKERIFNNGHFLK